MRKDIKILVLIGGIVVIAAMIGAKFYRESVQSQRTSTEVNSTLVRPDSPTLGGANATVTLVEFLDPECESCSAFYPTVKQILKDYDGKVKLVVRYMPFHKNSIIAATFAEAAGEQGKYWEILDVLFSRQLEWGERHGESHMTPIESPNALFEKYAMEQGLDVEKIKIAVAQNRYAAKLERDKRDGESLGVSRTPTFFVNGRQLARFNEQDLRSLIDEELTK